MHMAYAIVADSSHVNVLRDEECIKIQNQCARGERTPCDAMALSSP